ncbi:uncharacterized protein [Nicotiana tomentosiformis]|uniref:uncharacterized protein n=1 Tax=Nicotiana tomentosiformis TaxID=4098 RepID=UPI00388C51C6
MVRTRTANVPDHGRAAPPVARGRGRAPFCGRGRKHPRVSPVTPPVDPVEDLIIEMQGEREELGLQFEQLQQGHMSVADYEVRFSELSHHALMIFPTDEERVQRFVAGLHSTSQATMAREVEMGTSYELVIEIARRIEGARQHAREKAMRDKRFRYSGELSGAPTGGRESSYCTPAIQGSSSGYSGHQGQTSGQQSADPRGFYECGDLGHVKRFCPRLQGKAAQQGHQPMIKAPSVPPVIRPPRGGGQVGRGYPRGGGQTGGGQSGGAPARFYAFSARPDIVASDTVITCIISVCRRDAWVLFDPGSTYSYVSSLFAHFLGVTRESLGTPV